MPAVQLFKINNPSCKITVLIKSKIETLWMMCSCVDAVIDLRGGVLGSLKAAVKVRECGFDGAFIFPNSFRSALIPFLARVPVRTGVPGHQRQGMLTDLIRLKEEHGRRHQAWEYLDIMGLSEGCTEIAAPSLSIPEQETTKARELLGQIKPKSWIGLMPGAAYGPAKRWPAEYFIKAGRMLLESDDYGIVVMGTKGEAALCGEVRDGIGKRAISLAGRTSLPELAALLGLFRAVITNDSGGMHLATAVGTPVVAIVGTTDPAKTVPLG